MANDDGNTMIEKKTASFLSNAENPNGSLKDSQEKYNLLLELSNDGILIVQDGKIRESNDLMAQMCGYAVEEILDTDFASFFQPEDMALFEFLYDHLIGDPSAVEVHEMVLICKNGRKLNVEIAAGRFIYKKDPAILLIVKHTTDLINAHKALKRSKQWASIAALSGGIAHDYNNLLTAIMGNISLARTYLKPKEKPFALLEHALAASKTAKNLTHRLISFSKGGVPQKTRAPVAKLVQSATEFTLSGSNVKSEYTLPDDLWPVEVDKIQIGQAIYNVVMNAREAMPRGGILEVCAENVKHQKNGNYVRISFCDHGHGIPADDLPKIFDPYFSTKNMDAQKSTGLGLSVCHSIVIQHGGDIMVDSKPDWGTTIHLYLPAVTVNLQEDNLESPQEEEIPLFGEGRILVMDDEEIIRELAEKILTHLGYDFEFAANGSEAVELYRNALEAEIPFDAVVLDLTVRGGMGGKEAIQEILQFDSHVKGIVSSGYSADPGITDFRKYGFKGVVTKPYTLEELNQELTRVLDADGQT
jgi:PAS domain S-box-containing protein